MTPATAGRVAAWVALIVAFGFIWIATMALAVVVVSVNGGLGFD